jgi:hypothetical protein
MNRSLNSVEKSGRDLCLADTQSLDRGVGCIASSANSSPKPHRTTPQLRSPPVLDNSPPPTLTASVPTSKPPPFKRPLHRILTLSGI